MSPSPDNRETDENGKLRVLVVDDEPTLRLGFAYALSNRHTVVETASNGRTALERINSERFDIMILDLRMPEIDGTSVIEELRATGNKLPVVLCSAALSPNVALRAIRDGVVDFLLKPVRPVDLRQAIEHVLRPADEPLPQALQAGREGRTADAIQILEEVPDPDHRILAWLGVLRSIRDIGDEAATGALEEMIGHSLSSLAFNAPSPS